MFCQPMGQNQVRRLTLTVSPRQEGVLRTFRWTRT